MKNKFSIITIIIISLLFIANGIALASWGFQASNTRLDTDTSNNVSTYPKLCSDNNGYVYAVWIDARGGIYFNRSNDHGQNWLSNDVLIASVTNPASLKIGCDNTGHVYIVWRQNDNVYLKRSSDFGQNFSSIIGIAGPVSEGYDFTSNQNGHLVVVWNTNSNYDLFVSYSTNHGASWSSPVNIISPRQYWYDFHKSPSVAIDNNGHVYVVWLDDKGLTPLEHIVYFNSSSDYGQTWQTDFPISQSENGYVGEAPQIVCDNNGHVYSAWLKTTWQQPNVLYFNKSDNYGQNWTGVQYIDWYLDKHQLKVSDNGNVYLAWNDTQSEWTKIKFRSSFDYGLTWQPTVMVTNEPNNCELGNFDFATKGNSVYMVWENNEPWQGILFNFSKNGGVAWQNRNGWIDNNSGHSVATNKPMISVDTNENIYVAWEDGRNGANTDIYFDRGDYILDLNEKIKLEADYLVACQYLNPGDIAHGAINDVHTPTAPPDYVVPRENGMAILGLLKAYEVLGDVTYLQRANLSMDYLVRVQEVDGSWRDEYDYRTPPGSLSKSPTQPAEVMMAMYMLGYRDDRYNSMKNAAQYLFLCQNHGYQQKLICGGKDENGNLSDWNWITDNSYAYWALLAARGWALVKGETSFAQECADAAADILYGINNYFKNSFDVWWWQVVDNWGNSFNNGDIIDWLNYTPRFLDLPASGVNNSALGEWIHTTFQEPSGNGGCLWGERHPNQEYPGMSFQAAFSWFDLGQNDYANSAINWAENSSLWQLIPDENGILGGWVDWINLNDPAVRAGSWERYVDTSFYSIGSWLGGYDFTVFDNEPPVLSAIGSKYVEKGSLLTFTISATDPDGDGLKFKAYNLPSGATFNETTRTFSWQPIYTGIYIVRFEVNDGYLIDYEDVTIRVASPGCFLAGTPILMADGSTTRPIEKIKVGDMILAYDVDKDKMVKDKVKEVFVHDSDNYLIVNDDLKVTPSHPVYAVRKDEFSNGAYSDGKWVEIGNLKVGDKILKQNGQYQEIKTIQKIQSNEKVYNFEVNPYHTYIANGYVAHNRKIIYPRLEAEQNYP